jgi:hypothetical protein
MRGIKFIGLFGGALCLSAMVSLAESENLLRNGSFEEASTYTNLNAAKHWKKGDPDAHGHTWGSATRDIARAVDGEYSGVIQGIWADRGDRGGTWQENEATPGNTYVFSGKFFCDPEWVAKTQEIKIEFRDATRSNRLAIVTQSITNCDVDWITVSVNATAPEGTAWIRTIVAGTSIGPSGSLYFDELTLAEKSY